MLFPFKRLEHFEEVRADNLKLEPVREHVDIFKKNACLAMLLLRVDHLREVILDLSLVILDVMFPKELNERIAKKIISHALRVLTKDVTE